MNELQVFSNPCCEELYQFEKDLNEHFGVFYAVEFGECIKIGKSAVPYRRMTQLRNVAKYSGKALGRVCVSSPHINFSENEVKIHDYFSCVRRNGTELFDLKLDSSMERLPEIKLEFLDDSAQIVKDIERRSNVLISFVKNGLGLNLPRSPEEQIREQLIYTQNLVKGISSRINALGSKQVPHDCEVLSIAVETVSQTMQDMGYPTADVEFIRQIVLDVFGYSLDDYLDLRDLYGLFDI